MPAGLPADFTAVTPNTEGNMEKRKQMLKSPYRNYNAAWGS